jgi:hypothetical protein
MFGWEQGAVVKLRVLFLFCYFDDSHVSELEGHFGGGYGHRHTGTLAHWHAWTTIPSRGPDQYGTVQYSTVCEVHTVQDSAFFPRLPITGHRTGKIACRGFRPRGWAVRAFSEGDENLKGARVRRN